MSKFFIDRPIFAWVVAIFITLAGIVSLFFLPIEQYPQVAAPTINLRVTYPGADAATIDSAVMSRIETQMNGLDGLDYMESKSSSGGGSLSLTFKTGIDPDMAQVDVQNRLARIEPRLPNTVKQYGITVSQSQSSFLMAVSLYPNESAIVTVDDITDYANRNILPELQRIEGVGEVQLFGGERAMRIWVDTNKLRALGLSFAEVNAAIATQNVQISAGELGAMPNTSEQTTTAPVLVTGQFKNDAEFENIIVRANTNGSFVRLKDVAKIEIGSQSYAVNGKLNGQPSVTLAVQLATNGNAVAVASAVENKMKDLARYFPEGVEWMVPFDTSEFVSISISKVVQTLVEAIVLVFLVMLLFLQNFRYTLIPTIVVPIALLGALAVVYVLGMSVNVLTMFAMVLVIGIVVDDAIVVVENVERIMAQERLSPLAATKKAMSQISGAVVGITVVLVSVFIPMAFFGGATGNIYRQFSVVMAVSILFSAFLALSLTPALCATLLKPVHQVTGDNSRLGRFYAAFNKKFDAVSLRYEGRVGRLLPRMKRMIVIYIVLLITATIGFYGFPKSLIPNAQSGFMGFVKTLTSGLPKSFLPTEDQGVLITMIQMDPGTTAQRTQKTVDFYTQMAMQMPEIKDVISVVGFSFLGSGQNVGFSFITLKPWDERNKSSEQATAIANKLNGIMMTQLKDGFVRVITPPSIPGLGVGSDFTFRLQDRNGAGHEALLAARNQLLGMAAQSPVLQGVRPDGLEDASMLHVTIKRDAAAAQGVSISSIGTVLASALGSTYVNDFPNAGRLQQVLVQADAKDRMTEEDLLKLTVLNSQGKSVPLSSVVSVRWDNGQMQALRYNGYPAMAISGAAAHGYSSGEAIAEMEKLASQLPQGFGFEWTGQTKQEIQAGSQSLILYAFSILAVFLCLAALYESWTIPVAVLLVVPLGFFGIVMGTWGRNLFNMLTAGWLGSAPLIVTNDVFFQVAMITVIGLSAKNAILIVEFAKDLQASGKSPLEAALAAVHLRFRPILMTSFAFIMGVVPLYFASGANSISQKEIGTGVFFGMLIGTILSVFFVPLFYTFIRSLFKDNERQKQRYSEHAREAGITPELADEYLRSAERSLSEKDKYYLHTGKHRP